MIKLRVVDDLSGFKELGKVWNTLLQRSLDNDVFSTWEWLWNWWRHFGAGRSLRVLVAEEDDEIIGVAPFMLSKYSFGHVGSLSRIEFISFPHGDYNNLILLDKSPIECVKLFLEGLLDFSDWNLLDLRDIRDNSVTADCLRKICSEKDFKLRLLDGTFCPYVNLPSSFDAFMAGLSCNLRRNLRKRLRKLQAKYKVEFKSQRDFSSLDRAMEAFFKLHQERWKAKGMQGAFASEEFKGFHLDVAKAFDEKGWLDLRFLTVDDVPVASAYTFDYNFKKYGYLTGFDPEFAKYGVGNMLKTHLVEECIRKRFREYDLTRDFEPYKADWATGVRKNLGARLIRSGLFARTYSWALEKRLTRWMSSKFGAHLIFRRE
jgi:CelD/BcsL family acetyltransferase involved in cellulose biosynthesis